AVTGSPLWNFTPRRRTNSYVSPSGDTVHDSASAGASGLPGSAFSIASWSPYSTMNGVTIPGVSAGSNHVGESEMWTGQLTWASGAAAAGTAATAEISRTRTVTERRGLIMSLQRGGYSVSSVALQCRPAPPGVGAGAGKYSATGISITLGPFDARASFRASAISSGRSTYMPRAPYTSASLSKRGLTRPTPM